MSRVWLCGAWGLFAAACSSDPQSRSNVPDEPTRDDHTPVIVIGGPTRKAESSEPLAIAGDEPESAANTPALIGAIADTDLVTIVRDPRKWQRPPRTTSLLVTEIQSLEVLTKTVPTNAPDRPRLLRRLADTYFELKNAARRDKQRASNARDIAKSERIAVAAQKRAIAVYEELANKHANFCQSPHPTDPAQSHGCIDDVLYFLGLEYQEMDAPQATRKHYFELIKSFPASKWVPYAYLGFGELFFAESLADPSKLDLAQKTYEKVLQFPAPQNETSGFAQYRMAQIHHRKQDDANALAHFVKAIDFATNFSTLPSSPFLRRAAQTEIVPSYAAAGTPRKAAAFFNRLTNDPPGTNEQLVRMLDHLVQLYLRENKRVEAADVCYSYSGGASALPACRSIGPSAIQPGP